MKKIKNTIDILEILFDFVNDQGHGCHINDGGTVVGYPVNNLYPKHKKLLRQLFMEEKISGKSERGFPSSTQPQSYRFDTWVERVFKECEDVELFIKSSGANFVTEYQDKQRLSRTRFYKTGSICAVIGAVGVIWFIFDLPKVDFWKNKEGILPSSIEGYNKQEHNSIGDKNENSAQQAKDNSKAEQTDSKNVLSEKRDERDRTTNSSDRTSNTKNNTGEKLEQTTRAILLYSLPHIPLQGDSIEFNIRTNRSKLLWALPNTKEVSNLKGKKKIME